MNIHYQGIPGSYSHITSKNSVKNLSQHIDNYIWHDNFWDIWKSIDWKNIAVLPIENSYAWNIHENIYNFLRYKHKIIWELHTTVEHCLLSKETDLSKIHTVYSHPQALAQCHNFLEKHGIKPHAFSDTAWAAKYVQTHKKEGIASISSHLCEEIYDLNLIQKWIQDQNWNTTRFFIIAPEDSHIEYSQKSWKISLIFEAKHKAASLYQCLWAFAKNKINLTKIESIPSLKDPFSYMFWVDVEANLDDNNFQESLDDLEEFTYDIKILWAY